MKLIKKIIKIFRTFIIIAVAFFILMFKLQDQSFFIERLVSIFDFKNDLANLERISKWLLAIEQFFNHLWLGMGIGAAGIIGKGNTEEINVAEVFVAESYYLKTIIYRVLLPLKPIKKMVDTLPWKRI